MAVINDGLTNNSPRYVDLRAGKIASGKSVPYANEAEALAAINIAYRCYGKMVNIAGVWVQFNSALTGFEPLSPDGIYRSKTTAGSGVVLLTNCIVNKIVLLSATNQTVSVDIAGQTIPDIALVGGVPLVIPILDMTEGAFQGGSSGVTVNAAAVCKFNVYTQPLIFVA